MNFNVQVNHRADIVGLVELKFCISMRLPGEAEAPSLRVWGHMLVAGPRQYVGVSASWYFPLTLSDFRPQFLKWLSGTSIRTCLNWSV